MGDCYLRSNAPTAFALSGSSREHTKDTMMLDNDWLAYTVKVFSLGRQDEIVACL
jgi:hypothetical protein